MIDVGDKIPDMELVAPDGSPVKISDYAGKKLVLFFYPKASTPGCTTESKDFSALLPEFEKAGAAVLGMSADSPKRQQNQAGTDGGYRFRRKHRIPGEDRRLGGKENVRQDLYGYHPLDLPDRTGWYGFEGLAEGEGQGARGRGSGCGAGRVAASQ